MTKRKKNIIGHDPLAWISVDDENDAEVNTTKKQTAKQESEPHPFGIDLDSFMKGYELMKNQVEDIVADFYEKLFSDYPEVKPLFDSSNIKEQEKKLAGAISLLVNNINDGDRLVSVLSGLGKSHQKFGATEAHYSAVATTLLAVIKNNIGRKWTKKIAQNWQVVLSEAADVMLSAYDDNEDTSAPGSSENIDTDNINKTPEEENVYDLDETQDISTAEELLDNLKTYITAGQVRINVSKVKRIDAACLQVLYLLFRDADISHYEAKIIGTSEAFERSAHLLGMSDVFKVAA